MSWDFLRGLYGEPDEERDEQPRRPAPGKVTLTSKIKPVQRRAVSSPRPSSSDGHEFLAQPVQRRAARAAEIDDPFALHLSAQRADKSPDAVHAAAARGVATAAQPLPHLEQIQRSFGRHDVTHVQAHVGGAAADASAAMGAEAYATGDHVAFQSMPALHTAAHEAAHVVQQKDGVQLKGGVGEVGDAYERHADAVADKVVAGESAERLLDQMTRGVASNGDHSSDVQFKKLPGAPLPPQGVRVGPSTSRLVANPRGIKFQPTEYGQTTYEEVVLSNTSAEPFHVHDFIGTVLPDLDGTRRTDATGDFAVVGGETGGDGLVPGASMTITIAFSPKASHPADLRRKKYSWRNGQFSVTDSDGAIGGTLKVRGPARPPTEATADANAVADVTASARSSEAQLPAPQTYAEMRHHVMAARDLVKTSERESAADLLDDVVVRMNTAAHYDLVFQAAKKHGLGSTSAVIAVGKARDELTHAARKLHDRKGLPVQMDLVVTAFEVAKEPLQLTLGEIDHAPGLQAMHDAAPAVLAGKGAVELGVTAKRIVTDAAFAAGFGLGVLEGAGGAVKDLATGVADVLELAFDIARTFVTSGLIGTTIHVAGKVGDFFDKAPAAMAAMGQKFKEDWNNPDSFECGNFRGEVIGYIATQIAIIIISGGAAAEGIAFAALSRWGKLVAIIQKLDAAGDIFSWASKAGGGLGAARRALFRKIRHARNGGGTRIDVPGGGPHEPGAPGDSPHGHDGTNGADKPHDQRGRDADAEPDAPDADVDIVPDRTRAPYEDPRVEPAGPRRPLDRRELLPFRKLDSEFSWKDIEKAHKSGHSVPIGNKLKKASDGHGLLARLAKGDASALEDIGINGVPAGFDTTGREWALVELRDGFVLYSGSYRSVLLPNDVRVLGHTHPGPSPSAPDDAPKVDRSLRDGPDGEGLTFAEILTDPTNARDSGIIPSASDISTISDGTSHVLYTRFAHAGDGKLVNPLPGDPRPRVQVHLENSKVVRWHERRKQYWYEVQAVVKDANGKELWSGKLYAQWSAPGKIGDTFAVKPQHFPKSDDKEWQHP